MTQITRQTIIDTLNHTLGQIPFIHAGWLGGSDASGRTDRWSDIDLGIVVDDDRIEDAYQAVHESLESLAPIELKYRFPMPTWHGNEQELIRLTGSDPCHFVDMVIMTLSQQDRLLERERHGEALVLFDHRGLTSPPAFDRQGHLQKVRKRLETLRVIFPLTQNLVIKAVRRNIPLDAIFSYMGMTLRPLVELLRIRHDPDRFDFGPRYLDRDLPAELLAEVEALAFPASVSDVEDFQSRAQVIFQETMAALDRGEWKVGSDD
jgi:predicted nucleotidyltransferase